MRLQKNFFIWLICLLLIQGCQPKEVTLINDIAGEWKISQIAFRQQFIGSSGSDSTVKYSNAVISFSRNNKSGEGWYSFDGQEKVPFFFYAHPEPENDLFVNVGTRTGPGLHPLISLNGEAPFLERSSNRLVIDFSAGFRNSSGTTSAQSHKARAVLVR